MLELMKDYMIDSHYAVQPEEPRPLPDPDEAWETWAQDELDGLHEEAE